MREITHPCNNIVKFGVPDRYKERCITSAVLCIDECHTRGGEEIRECGVMGSLPLLHASVMEDSVSIFVSQLPIGSIVQ